MYKLKAPLATAYATLLCHGIPVRNHCPNIILVKKFVMSTIFTILTSDLRLRNYCLADFVTRSIPLVSKKDFCTRITANFGKPANKHFKFK